MGFIERKGPPIQHTNKAVLPIRSNETRLVLEGPITDAKQPKVLKLKRVFRFCFGCEIEGQEGVPHLFPTPFKEENTPKIFKQKAPS